MKTIKVPRLTRELAAEIDQAILDEQRLRRVDPDEYQRRQRAAEPVRAALEQLKERHKTE